MIMFQQSDSIRLLLIARHLFSKKILHPYDLLEFIYTQIDDSSFNLLSDDENIRLNQILLVLIKTIVDFTRLVSV